MADTSAPDFASPPKPVELSPYWDIGIVLSRIAAALEVIAANQGKHFYRPGMLNLDCLDCGQGQSGKYHYN